MLIGRLIRLGPATANLGLAVLAIFRPGLAQAGIDWKIVCFTFLMYALYFWFPGRFRPGLGLGRGKIWLKRLVPNRPRPKRPINITTVEVKYKIVHEINLIPEDPAFSTVLSLLY